jgi:redox-sensitive bicupin YhaK (pirin superfamily)
MTVFLTRSQERMHTEMDWLDSWHSFSFGGHYDPERMGFGPLRVVNDDRIAPGKGFGTHLHSDMEIVTLVLEGQLQHKDSMGNGRIIQTGDIQYMSAGTGVMHSEFNPSGDTPVHLMQIWIQPSQKGLEPRYADQSIMDGAANTWNLLLSPDGRNGSMEIRQDVTLSSASLEPHQTLSASTKEDRGFWMFVLKGAVTVAGETLAMGDSAAIQGVETLNIESTGSGPARILLFDVPL